MNAGNFVPAIAAVSVSHIDNLHFDYVPVIWFHVWSCIYCYTSTVNILIIATHSINASLC